MKPTEKLKEILDRGIQIKDLDLIQTLGHYFAQKDSFIINNNNLVKKLNEYGIKILYIPTEKDKDNQKKVKEKEALSTSQLRKFFGVVKKIQMDFENFKDDIPLLIPKMAYAVGRDKDKSKIKEFYQIVKPLIENINGNEKKFQNFVNILEAIVAYHKEASKD